MKIAAIVMGRVLLLALLLLGGAAGVRAEEISQEYQLKLAFMVNFARFVTWPETSFSLDQPQVTLCLFDKNPFGKALAGVVGKKIGEFYFGHAVDAGQQQQQKAVQTKCHFHKAIFLC